ncbi:membrane metallo-endopeptidase-like 1 [Babylonia areolata]|uniref:membrane metallo-endopeptidase-like 1 n=1 Tax=Babylonia areolata TaxID=304850 RepID=UPI003FD68FEE
MGSDRGEARSVEEIEFSEGKSKREKILAIFLAIFVIATIVFLVLFLHYYFLYDDAKDSSAQAPLICSTAACLSASAQMASAMDRSVKPCDDFYQFACGRWALNHPTSVDNPAMDVFVPVRESISKALRDLLDVTNESYPDSVKKAQDFYKSCVNTDVIDQLNHKPLLDLIKSRGPNVFPTLDGNSWVDEKWKLSQIVTRVPRYRYQLPGRPETYSIHMLFPMLPWPDMFQANRSIIYITEPVAPYNKREMILGQYSSFILDRLKRMYTMFTVALGANSTEAEKDAEDVMQFMINVLNITTPTLQKAQQQQNPNKYVKRFTIQNLTNTYPAFDWLEFFNTEFSSVGINLTMEEEVLTDGVGYLDQIFQVINSTSRRTLLNFGMWRFIISYGEFLGTPMREDLRTLRNTVFPTTVRPQLRWQLCVERTESFFRDAIGRLYIDKHFSLEKRTEVEDMVADLKDAFRDIVREADWMSQPTKEAALAKVDAIVNKIGYLDYLKNDTYLDEKLKDITINKSDVFGNLMKLADYRYRTLLRALRQPVDRRSGFAGSVVTVNAFYNPQTNSIIFPAAFLQKPILNDKSLEAIMYGSLGFFIGHEITHGFDNTGADYDEIGSHRKWWKEEDLQNFESRGQCMVDQYNRYSFPQVNMSINGQLTLGENIADNGGLKEAFKAYKKMVAKKGEEPRLPVLDYSPDQLFFISAAQFWCNTLPDEFISAYLADVHSPGKFRVIGPMQNSEDFARTFSCPQGSYMNPKDKCHVW